MTRKLPDDIFSRQTLPEVSGDNVPAWEILESGRYMPRRIRGSFRGRELG